MASILKQITVAAAPDEVWEALCDFGGADRRMAPGVLSDCRIVGDERVVTFANGLVLHERLLDVDEAERRLAYTARGGAAISSRRIPRRAGWAGRAALVAGRCPA
jgi:hypothetical protein